MIKESWNYRIKNGSKKESIPKTHKKTGMITGISLVVMGLIIIAFSLFGLTNNPLSLATWLQISHQHYVILFGIGFLLIGIRMLRKKND